MHAQRPDDAGQADRAPAIAGNMPGGEKEELPCIVMAELVKSACTEDTGAANNAADEGTDTTRPAYKVKLKLIPKFPQNSFVAMTANNRYDLFAAYFDLARQRTFNLTQKFKDQLLEKPASQKP